MRPSLLARVDEASALGSLRDREVNYDPARAPEDGSPEGHWHVDSSATLIGREPAGDPRPVYRQDQHLLGRDMLLEGRFFFLRFYFGVRVTDVCDETRDTVRGRERVWGWSYQTLQGHLKEGRITLEVIKNLGAGQIAFRGTGYSRAAPIPDSLVRFGFRVFGRHTQTRYYAAVQSRLYQLVQQGQRGEPLPKPAVQSDGLVLAPASARPHSREWLTIRWVFPGP